MPIKTAISSSSSNKVVQGTYRALLLVLCWSLISHRFAIALPTLETDKANDRSYRASYYAQGLSQQPTHPPTDTNHSDSKKGHNSEVIQPEPAAGAEMPHHLIYEVAVENKHIPRVSLLTCQHGSPARRLPEQTSINIDTLTILRMLFTSKNNRRYKSYRGDGGNISISSSSSDRRQSWETSPPKDFLIKVLRIDLLINSRVSESEMNKNRTNFAGSETLEAFLRSEVLRQLVVLDLSCGPASRKVIEMASNKGLFNSSYHWLLIEDYTFNRQGDDDDVDGDVGNDFQLPQDIFTDDATRTTTTDTGTTGPKSKDNKINNDGDDDDNNVAGDSNDNVKENNLLIEKFLEKINININTELILAKRINGDQDSKKDYYMLYDVWNPGLQYGGSLNITKIGKFSEDSGLQLEKWYRQTTTVIRRMDMKNARLRCMIVVTNKNHTDSLEDYLTQQYDTHLDSMNRFNFALLSHVRDLFNFSLVMSHTPSWGYLKNGKFDGMIGALVRRQADIGGSPIFSRIERAKVIDYTTKTWIVRQCFVFRQPRTVRTDQIVFLQPFTNDVWVLVAIYGGVTIALLAALTIVERRLRKGSNNSAHFQRSLMEQRKKNAECAILRGNRKNNHQQLYHNHRTKDVRRRVKKRQIDIEVSSFTQKDALPLARDGTFRDNALRCGGVGGNGCSNATILKNERFNTRTTTTSKRGQVSADYGGGISERSAIDCIDYDAGVSGPINGIFPHSNDRRAGCTMMAKTLKASLTRRRKHFHGKDSGVSSKVWMGMILESLLFYTGSICQQGLSFPTNLLSGRCIVITSLLFSFCIYQFYSASIVGTQLMEKPKTIKTLQDVVHSSLEIGIEDIVYNREYFFRSRDPVAIELYTQKYSSDPPYVDLGFFQASRTDRAASEKRIANAAKKPAERNHNAMMHSNDSETQTKATDYASNWYYPEHGVAKIKQGGFAFHIDVSTAYKIISDTFTEKEICDLTEIQLFPPQEMINIVQKGSPLRKIITYGLRRTMESGLMDHQRKVWHSPKPRCVKQIHTDDLMVDMQTFTSAVFVLIFGFAASIVLLALEMVHNNLWQYFAT